MAAPTTSGLVVITTDELKVLLREQIGEALGEHEPKAESEAYVSTPVMAERLSISRAKLHALASEPDAPCVWVGDTRRWNPAETIAWFRARGRVAK
jgi:hypothetical protein